MTDAAFYRDPLLPFVEAKTCGDKRLSYKRHFHEEYSIGLIEEGASHVWCEGRSFDVEAGRLIMIPPLVPHACNPEETQGWRYQMLFIRPDWLCRTGGEPEGWRSPFLPERRINSLLKPLLKRTVQCMRSGAAPLETETVLLHMMDVLRGGGTGAQPSGDAGTLPAGLARVKEYLHEHYLDRVTLEQLERISGISRYQIIHRFKREHHLPPHAYQNLLRINFAKKELCKRRPIAEVALEAGFYDQSHFTRLFKSFVGVTPSQYALAL